MCVCIYEGRLKVSFTVVLESTSPPPSFTENRWGFLAPFRLPPSFTERRWGVLPPFFSEKRKVLQEPDSPMVTYPS